MKEDQTVSKKKKKIGNCDVTSSVELVFFDIELKLLRVFRPEWIELLLDVQSN